MQMNNIAKVETIRVDILYVLLTTPKRTRCVCVCVLVETFFHRACKHYRLILIISLFSLPLFPFFQQV